ncbi:PAS domain-containing protein [Ferrovibrio terrae]|uniref:PAS domain-containing protein n=1 Tax=Ferrovibrio terrae TaxID=2594003 RepID=UPI003137BA4A
MTAAGDELQRSPLPRAPASPDTRPGLDLSRLQDARLLRARAWWQGLADEAGTALPDRSQLEPATIRDLLPYAILWDVVPQPDDSHRFRCRLAGTMLDEMRGRPPRGQWLHERFTADTLPEAQADHEAVVQLAQPLLFERSMRWVDKPYYKFRRLMLPFTHRAAAERCDDPLLADPARVAMLFSVVSFIDA